MTRTAPKIQSQGVGKSKLFGGNTPPEHPEGKSARCHVNGDPLPEQFWDSFPYSLTDEGKADAAKMKKDLPVSYAGRGEGDPFDYDRVADDDKKLEKFADDLKRENRGPRLSRDAMRQLMERHTPKGHRGLWIGKLKSEREGLLRDNIEYRPVMTKNPETGAMERVNIGGMFLASVPEDLALDQEQLNQETARAKQVTVTNRVTEQAEKIMSSSDMQDLARRRRTLEDLGGPVEDNPEQADRELLEHEVVGA